MTHDVQRGRTALKQHLVHALALADELGLAMTAIHIDEALSALDHPAETILSDVPAPVAAL